VKLAEYNRIQLVWVLRHMGIDGNKIADQLATQGFSLPLIGPQHACGITAKGARGVIRGWMNRKHEEYWQSICGQRQGKGFPNRSSAKRAGELLNLSRN
jgi:hypothetical protein